MNRKQEIRELQVRVRILEKFVGSSWCEEDGVLVPHENQLLEGRYYSLCTIAKAAISHMKMKYRSPVDELLICAETDEK